MVLLLLDKASRMVSMLRRLAKEDGVSLISVAVWMFVLTGFLMFVVDYGVMWLARGQAQNAADAGALAGAVAVAFDSDTYPPEDDIPEDIATAAATSNLVIGEAGGVNVLWQCPLFLAGTRCVRVDVHRDNTNGSTRLPTFFANMFGIGNQDVRATATAQATGANSTNCLKPWLIPDRYADVDEDGEFSAGDYYQAPTEDDPGTGYTINDIGTELLLKAGNPNQAISPSDFYEIGEAGLYEESIAGCLLTAAIGDTVTALPGNRVGPTNQGVTTLVADGPVVVVVALFSPAAFDAMRRQSGNFTLVITNLLGFRIEGQKGNAVYGTIAGAPAEMDPEAADPNTAALTQVIRLVR
jgi:Flp pilus assembly protein TadG